jgi:hypothetical protein
MLQTLLQDNSDDRGTATGRLGSLCQINSLSSLPNDLHSFIYSFLKRTEKLIFISLSKDIYLRSQHYREMKFTRKASLNYAFDHKFKERVLALVFARNISLNLWEITDEQMSSLDVGNVHFIHFAMCKEITEAGVAHLSKVHSLSFFNCHGITDACLAYLSDVHDLNISLLNIHGCWFGSSQQSS